MGQTPVRRSLHALAEDIIPVRGAGSVRRAGNPPRQACYLSAWSKLHENHPTQKPEARCSSAWTTSPHTGKPLSDIFESPPGTAPAHGEPFLRVFPAHPAAGVTSYPENPSQGTTPNIGHWQPPRMQKITPIYSRFLRPPPHTENPFYASSRLTCGGYNLIHGVPFSEGHTRCRPLELPHTRGEALFAPLFT